MDTVFSALMTSLIGFGQYLGFERHVLLNIVELGEDDLADPDAMVPLHGLILLWQHYLRRYPERALGMEYAQMIDMSQFGAFGLLCLHSPTLRVAIEHLIRYQSILDPLFVLGGQHHQDLFTIVFDHTPEVLALVEPMELFMGTMCYFSHRQSNIRPSIVTMAHPQKHPISRYTEAFGCPVIFDHPAYTIVLPAQQLETPIQQASAPVSHYISKYLDSLLDNAPPPMEMTLSARTTSWLMTNLHDNPTYQDAASALLMSPRTLQRKLKQEQTSYSKLLLQVRQSCARRWLEHTHIPIYEVALLLGYHDTASFYRAFKQWTGQTPEALRRASQQI